jgi:hypothetical protein
MELAEILLLCCEIHAVGWEEVAVDAPIQSLWHHISHWPILRFFPEREPLPEPPQAPDEVAFRFKDGEGDYGPSAEKIEGSERERAEKFKRDQLLPIMGWSTGAPGWMADTKPLLLNEKEWRIISIRRFATISFAVCVILICPSSFGSKVIVQGRLLFTS